MSRTIRLAGIMAPALRACSENPAWRRPRSACPARRYTSASSYEKANTPWIGQVIPEKIFFFS
jgi:hypothetical protein